MKIKKFEVGPLLTNCYLLNIKNHYLIIDPGFYQENIKNFLFKKRIKIDYIFLTHGHPDHCGAALKIKENFGGKIIAHPLLNEVFNNLKDSFLLFKKLDFSEIIPDIKIESKKIFNLGKEKLYFLNLPGHSPDSLVLIYKSNIFSGDLIFKDGIGRFDLYKSNFEDLKDSIKKILTFPENYKIFPGHGEPFVLKDFKLFFEKSFLW